MSGNELSKTISSIKESSSLLEKSLENFHKENSRKVIRSNIRLLKKISNDYNLDYDKLYKEYIEVKIKNDSIAKQSIDSQSRYKSKKNTKVELNSIDSKEDPSDSNDSNEKILSKIEIKGEGFWIDDNTNELYSLDFKSLGIYEK